MDPLIKDQELARSYLRGERDGELFGQPEQSRVVAPKGSVQDLHTKAAQHGILKIHGQRGLTATGGLKLLSVIGSDLQDFPTYEQVIS